MSRSNNVYAPNNPTERRHFIDILQSITDINFITMIAGDFNCAPDCKFDREPISNVAMN